MEDGINRYDHHNHAKREARESLESEFSLSKEHNLARLSLIVESGESKMIRQRQQQQQQQQLLQLQQQQSESSSSGGQRQSLALLKQLKSPAFARNTLDEDCLRRLASSSARRRSSQATSSATMSEEEDLVTNQLASAGSAGCCSELIVNEHQMMGWPKSFFGDKTTPTKLEQGVGMANPDEAALISALTRGGGEGGGYMKEKKLDEQKEHDNCCTAVSWDDSSSFGSMLDASALAGRERLEACKNEDVKSHNINYDGKGNSMMIRMLDGQQQKRQASCKQDDDIRHSMENLSGTSATTDSTNIAVMAAAATNSSSSPSSSSSSATATAAAATDKLQPSVDSLSCKRKSGSPPEIGFKSSLSSQFRQLDLDERLGSAAVAAPKEESPSSSSYQQQRRHSTYMLPIVLNNRRLLEEADKHFERELDYDHQLDKRSGCVYDDEDGHDHDDDDDDDYDYDDDGSVSLGPQDSVSLESSSRLTQGEAGKDCSSATDNEEEEGEEDEEEEGEEMRAETARLLATPRAPHQPEVVEPRKTTSKQVSSRLVMKSVKIPNSASSPSSLSTPTNDCDCDQAKLGCGGPCCSRPMELIKLANENAANSSQQQQQQQQSLFHKIAGTKMNPADGIMDWRQRVSQGAKVTKSSNGNKEVHHLGRKTRIGSNPLDRLRIFNADSNASSTAARLGQSPKAIVAFPQQQTKLPLRQQLQPETNNNNKRHSIISIFSSLSSSANTNSSHSSQRRRLSSLVGVGGGGFRLSEASQLGARGPRNSLEGALQFHRRNKQQLNLKQQQQLKQQHQQQQSYDPLIPESGFKIVVMGTSGSGKTAIIQRFLYDSFNKRHVPTVEDTYFIEFPHKKNLINISISDTSGTYQFPAMRRLAINSGDAFVLVYSVDDLKSFDDLEKLRQTILDEREQAYLEASASIMSHTDSLCSTATSGLGSSSLNNSAASIASNIVTNATAATTTKHPVNNYPTVPNHYSDAYHQGLTKAGGGNIISAGDAGLTQLPHRSLASLFQSNNNNQPHHCYQANNNINSSNSNNINTNTHIMNASSQQHGPLCSSSSTSSSTDNSRRSSVSAAEAALKTRRTRRPPMVIVANKHDLPEERHLVNSDEIEALTVIDWNNGFVRASAALNLNISEIFQEVLRQARQPPTLTEAIVSKRRKSLPPKLQ